MVADPTPATTANFPPRSPALSTYTNVTTGATAPSLPELRHKIHQQPQQAPTSVPLELDTHSTFSNSQAPFSPNRTQIQAQNQTQNQTQNHGPTPFSLGTSPITATTPVFAPTSAPSASGASTAASVATTATAGADSAAAGNGVHLSGHEPRYFPGVVSRRGGVRRESGHESDTR